jgi:protein gp37
MAKSKIEWTDATWNPVTGCSKVSPGCVNCYAERLSLRLQAMGVPKYRDGFEVRIHPEALELPLHWAKPQTIFVNSMSDLFHQEVPEEYIQAVFRVMRQAHWHKFQLLTKRDERLAEVAPRLEWADNIWVGVSVENQKYVRRIDNLRRTPAGKKFLSLEPLLGPLEGLRLEGIDWVITGGESGPGARPVDPAWVRSIRDQCIAQDVPFFFKQWGGPVKKATGRLLDGRTWDQMPYGAD